MTTDEAVQIMERYIEWLNCDEIDATPLKDWLATDIVRLIELMDAELQRRADTTVIFDSFDDSELEDDEWADDPFGYGSEFYGHDPDLDENGYCRICGRYEAE